MEHEFRDAEMALTLAEMRSDVDKLVTKLSMKEATEAAEAGESASDFDRCHRACVQQSTQLKTLTKQSEMLTKLCDAWEAGLNMIRDIPC